jgi:alanine dehydrogenase
MAAPETLLLGRGDVLALLDPIACIDAVERAFDHLGRGLLAAPQSIGFDAPSGSFHLKVALVDLGAPVCVAKLNGNFPDNPARHGLPTIQGLLLVSDARDGRPLAVMDSGAITAVRTAAASAVAARRLARADSAVATIFGCGVQGREHVRALTTVLPLREFRVHDVDPARAEAFARAMGTQHAAEFHAVADAGAAARTSDVVVTCTPATACLLFEDDVRPGAFVCAVGADHPNKQEIAPRLMARARVVVDDRAACAAGGDLHHALAAGAMTLADVHADLAEIVTGARPGRAAADEVFLFDSTGLALEDAAAAQLVLHRARATARGRTMRFSE